MHISNSCLLFSNITYINERNLFRSQNFYVVRLLSLFSVIAKVNFCLPIVNNIPPCLKQYIRTMLSQLLPPPKFYQQTPFLRKHLDKQRRLQQVTLSTLSNIHKPAPASPITFYDDAAVEDDLFLQISSL